MWFEHEKVLDSSSRIAGATYGYSQNSKLSTLGDIWGSSGSIHIPKTCIYLFSNVN